MKCPNEKVGETHDVELKHISATLNYEFCNHCKEDVAYLARINNPTPAVQAAMEDFDEDEEDDQDDYLDDDQDLDQGVYTAPVNHNPHPVRVLGDVTASHRIVLLNDPNSGAHLVEQVLRDVFQKDYQESKYIMMDCHYNGRSICYYASEEEARGFLERVEAKKQEIAASGQVGANTIHNLQLVMEARPQA